MEMYKFECGCEFEIIDKTIKNYDGLPHLKIDFDNINYDCEKTWDLFSLGDTKGIFQLETNLGRKMSKEVKPENIEELSALISILRPGILKAVIDGKSMANRYIDRKHNREIISSLDKSLDVLLEDTYQVFLYQEQVMKIAEILAGFDLKEADELRKSVGKKDAALLAKVGEKFLKGCEKTKVVDVAKAEEIWSYILKGARYLFNKSHGVGYAYIGYWSAYVKAHFPVHFYTAWLRMAKEKIKPKEEIRQLIRAAKGLNINVHTTYLYQISTDDVDFTMNGNDIYFGAKNIKNIGQSQIEKLLSTVKPVEDSLRKPLKDFTWAEFLFHLTPKVNVRVITGLISVGGVDYYNLPRRKMLFEHNVWLKLTEKEQAQVNNHTDILSALEYLLTDGKVTKNRKDVIAGLLEIIKNPPYDLNDSMLWVNKTEEDLLGIPLTVKKLDACDIIDGDTTCAEFKAGKTGNVTLCVEITAVKETKIKNGASAGQKMGFIEVQDETEELDNIAIFAKEWEDLKNILYEGNTVLISGYRNKKNTLNITGARQI